MTKKENDTEQRFCKVHKNIPLAEDGSCALCQIEAHGPVMKHVKKSFQKYFGSTEG